MSLTSMQQSLVRFLLAGGYHREWKRQGWYNPLIQKFIPDEDVAEVETAQDAARVLAKHEVRRG